MSGKLYALLVGIDNYPNVQKLNGCVADAKAVDQFLHDHYGKMLAQPPKLLLDQEATRQGIIDAFRTHLGKAAAGDTVYFHFSGHGSRENAPEEFHSFFPEKKNETLVCYDSRDTEGLDLADKELAVLIAEVAQEGKVHVVVTLDSCHSGSGTRNTPELLAGARQTEAEGNARSLDTYLDGYYQKMLQDEGRLALPVAAHIVLSACLPTQLAYETIHNRGLFTSTLLEVLERTQGKLTYESLFGQVRARIRRKGKQEPVFNFYGSARACDHFLTQEPDENLRVHNVYYDQKAKAWKTDNGAIQGIPTESAENIRFQIFEPEATTFTVDQMLVELEASEVRQNETILVADEANQLNEEQTYVGVVASLPPAKLLLYSTLSETDNEAAIPKLLFELITVKEEANYLLEKTGNTYQILSQLTGNQIASENDASLAKDTLEKIAHWENTRQLANPKTKLETNDLEVAIYLTDDDGNHLKNEHGEDIRLLPEKDTHEFGFDLGSQEYIPCKYELTNHTNVDLFVAALAITPMGGVFRMNEKKIPKGSSAWMNTIEEDGTEDLDSIIFWPALPDEATECVIQIKYVASTQEHIDVSKLLQDDFSETVMREATDDLNLARFGGNRKKNKRSSEGDWFARDVFFRVTRNAQTIEEGKSTELPNTGIKINAPEGFEAKVQLGNITNGTRGISSRDYFINGLVNEAEGASLWSWGNASRSTQDYDLIELSDIKGDLSAEHPLVLEMDTGLQAQEWLVPVTFDGEHILPIGFGEVNESGQAKVSIDHLPEEQIKSRSIGRALKFAFYKITSKVFKIPKEGYHKLRAVEYVDEEGKFVYDDDQGKIKDKIKASSTGILLLLHGIIGNTDGIAEFVAPLVKGEDKRYDLVLTYDYENLTTPIPDIAMQLRELLEEAGISPTHTPKVDILAHSMGGLVSRWLIEQKDGNQFVERLILCGTPNEGSPFGKIDAYAKYARLGLIIGLNVLSPWKTVGNIVTLIAKLKAAQTSATVIGKITRTLEDMTPDSQFMKHLNDQGKDGGIPYTIFAGDIQDYLKESRPLLDKVLGMVGNIVNSKDPNDLAVKVESIKGKGKNTQVKLIDVACHHLNYFTEPNCMEPLMKVLEGE